MPAITQAAFLEAKLFIESDIEREIQLAQTSGHPARVAGLTAAGVTRHGGGNLLAALGLLCYTEFCGAVEFNKQRKTWKSKKDKKRGKPPIMVASAAENFSACFAKLGAGYAAFDRRHKVYGLFRCGMAHSYYAHGPFTIVMPGRNPVAGDPGISHNGAAPGVYTFWVETYFDHLSARLALLARTQAFPVQLPDR